MKKLLILLLFIVIKSNAQQLGFIAGYSNIGYNTNYYQPHYGFVLSEVYSTIIGTELSYIHYQPSYNNIRNTDSLPDYQKFGFNIKYGYFKRNIGIYGTQGISFNSSMKHHLGFHTHLSTNFGIGIEFIPFTINNPRLAIDIKYLRDIGLDYAQIHNKEHYTYNGNMFSIAIKYRLNVKD